MFYSLTSFSQLRVNQGALNGGGGGFADTTSFLLDQVDDHLLGTSNWGTITGSGEFTISMWVRFTSLTGYQKLFQCGDTLGGTGYILYGYVGSNGQIQVWSGGSGSNWTRSVVGAIVAGQWYHIVMRLSDISVNRYYRQRIFIDGAISNGGSNYYTNSIIQGSELSVGGAPSAIQSVDGNINEFAVWGSNALTDAQILEVYNSGSANDLKTLPTAPIPTNWFRSENANWLGGYYQLVDEMGSGYKLNTRNMAEASRVNDVPPNPWSNTLSTTFDGVDDYVDCGDNINLAITNISISAWIKTTADGSIMVADDSNGARRRWIFNTQASGTLLFLFWNTSSTIKSIAGTTAVNDGIWHHVMAINNGTDLKLYIDGVLDNSSLDGDTMNVNAYTYIHIGNSNYGGGANYFDGSIDEVAIWSNDQSSNVTTIYNSGVPNDVSTLSPLGYWRMGDGSTYPTINDLGSGGNNGTMNNMSSANFVADVPT